MTDNDYGPWFLVAFNSPVFVGGGFWLIADAWRVLDGYESYAARVPRFLPRRTTAEPLAPLGGRR